MTMQFIASSTVGAGGATTITFSSIPQTFTHLQLRLFTRTNAAGSESWQSLRFNDSTSGYANHLLYGNGSSAISAAELIGDRINFGTTAGNGATSNVFGAGIIDILDYTNTNKNKTVRFLDGYDNNGSGVVGFRSGLWANTAAITSITLSPQNFGGTAYLQNSRFDLYGITTSAVTGA